MKLYIKQKVFSFKDRFTIVNEDGAVVYTVEGKVFSIGKKLKVFDENNEEVVLIEEKAFSFRPRYYINIPCKDEITIHKKFSFKPKYVIEGSDWMLQGDFFGHNYEIVSGSEPIMSLTKKWFSWGDSYELDIENKEDMLLSVCIVLVVDACLEREASSAS